MALNINQAVYGLIKWMSENPYDINKLGVGCVQQTAFRSVKAFADANGIKKPANLKDVIFPDQKEVTRLPELKELT